MVSGVLINCEIKLRKNGKKFLFLTNNWKFSISLGDIIMCANIFNFLLKFFLKMGSF